MQLAAPDYVVIVVADLERSLASARRAPAGYPGRRASATSTGQRTAYLADPDGHLIELAQGL